MARKKSQYVRLPGRRSTLFSKETAWLGPDHILCVRSSRFVEHYRRFYYRDIQAIVLQEMKGVYSLIDFVVLVILGLFTLVLFAMHDYKQPYPPLIQPVHILPNVPYAGIFMFLAAGVWAILRAKKSNCITILQTSISLEQLRSLSRRRPALHAIALIQERVTAAQSDLANAPVVSGPVVAAGAVDPRPVPFLQSTPAFRGDREPAQLEPASRTLIAGVTALFIVSAAKFASALIPVPAFEWLMPLLYLACTLVLLLGLAQTGIRNISPVGRVGTLGAIMLMGMTGVFSGSAYFTLTYQDELQRRQMHAVKAQFDSEPLAIIVGTVLLILGMMSAAGIVWRKNGTTGTFELAADTPEPGQS